MAHISDGGYIVVYAATPSNRLFQTDKVDIRTARRIKDRLNENPEVTAWVEDTDLDIVEV